MEDKSLPEAELAALVKKAHEEICPYSHATRNNVDVQIEVVGGEGCESGFTLAASGAVREFWYEALSGTRVLAFEATRLTLQET